MSRYVPRPELAEAKQQGFHDIGEAAAATGVSAKIPGIVCRSGIAAPRSRVANWSALSFTG